MKSRRAGAAVSAALMAVVLGAVLGGARGGPEAASWRSGGGSRAASMRPAGRSLRPDLRPARGAAAAVQTWPGGPDGDVVIFVLDSPIDRRFLEGQVLGLRGEAITHGSIVGRVVRSYCSAPVVSVPAEDAFGAIQREAYLAGLRDVLRYVRGHPEARVLVNISLGTYERDPEEEQLIRQITEAGCLIVAAAGNDDTDEPLYPAAYTGVIAVASATEDGKALNSNYGRHIAIAASGDISFIDYEFLPYQRLVRVMEARGTSFAAPRVAATLAYVLARRPGMSPGEAMDVLTATASPIYGKHFDDGKLGGGLLSIYRAKAWANPLYRFLHYGLPLALCVLLGVLTAFLCLRYALVGVFVSMLVWLVGVPSVVLVGIETMAYLAFVGAGSMLVGLRATGILALGVILAGLVLHWNAPKMVLATAPAVALLLIVLRVEMLKPTLASASLGCVIIVISMLIEHRTRGVIRLIRAIPYGATADEAVPHFTRMYERAVDDRVRRAIVEAMLQFRPDQAAEALAAEHRHRRGAASLLAEIEKILAQEDAAADLSPDASGQSRGSAADA